MRDLDLELKEVINGVNCEIKVITQWLSKDLTPYFNNPNQFNRVNELEELALAQNKYIKNKIFFDEVKSMIVDFKGKLLSENIGKNESKIIQLRQEITNKNQEIYTLNDKYSKELTELQKYNEEKDKIRVDLMKNISTQVKIQYDRAIEKIKIFTKNTKWKGSNFTHYSFNFENIEDRLEVVFRFMNDLMNDYDEIILFSEESFRNKMVFEKNRKEQEDQIYKHKDELYKALNEKENKIILLEQSLNNYLNNAKKRQKENYDVIGQLEYEKQKLMEKLNIAERNILNLKNTRKTNV